MSTTPHVHLSPRANGGAPQPEPSVVASWAGVLRRRWGWGAAVFALVLGASVALILFAAPIYRSEARLRMAEPPPTTGVSPSASITGLFGLGGNAFANDLQVFGSRTLREAVVLERALNVRLVAPVGWHRDSLLVSLAAGRETARATFEASWNPEGHLDVRRTAPTDSVVGTFVPGRPASLGGFNVVFRPRKPDAPERFRLVTVPFGEAVRQLEGRIRVERASRDANVLDVRFDDPDPGLSERVAQSAVARFVSLRAELYQRESGQTVDSLRVVAAQTMAELRDAEDRLEALQRESGLVAAEAQSEALVERYGAALYAAEAAHAELEAVRTALARVEAAANPGEAWTTLVAHPQFLDNPTVGELLVQMVMLEQRRIQLATVRTTESGDYRTLLDQIESLDATLRSLARSYRDGLEGRVRLLDAQVSEMDRVLAAAPSLTTELLRRQRDVRVLTEVFVLTEQRLRQEELRQALTFSNVQVIDPPALRDRPVWPRKKLALAAGLLLAMGFGMLGMVVVERADGSVRSARQLAPYMASPLLAAVPAEGRNGGSSVVKLSPSEVELLLRRGRIEGDPRSRLVLMSAGDPADAERLAQALDAAAADAGALVPSLTVLPRVTSRAAAEAAARLEAPVLLVLRAGETESRTVSRILDLLISAGAPVAGGVLLCRTAREAQIAWS